MLANGLSATRTGYFRITRRLRQALGARGHHVGLAQLVEQVGAHDADQLRGAGQRQDQRRERQVLDQVPDLRPAPRRELDTRARTARRRWRRSSGSQIQDDQREQEVRHGQADEADEGEDVVADRILPHRRVDADRQRERPGEDAARRPRRTIVSHSRSPITSVTGRSPLHRHAEVALQRPALIHLKYWT